jgi:hypothetical protein
MRRIEILSELVGRCDTAPKPHHFTAWVDMEDMLRHSSPRQNGHGTNAARLQ